jgi:hypothetical protein
MLPQALPLSYVEVHAKSTGLVNTYRVALELYIYCKLLVDLSTSDKICDKDVYSQTCVSGLICTRSNCRFNRWAIFIDSSPELVILMLL